MLTSNKERLRQKIQSRALYSSGLIIVLCGIAAFIAIHSFRPMLIFTSISTLSVIIGILAYYLATKRLRKDLKDGKVKTEKQIIKNKFYKTIQVPGDDSKLDYLLIILSGHMLVGNIKTVYKYTAVTEDEHIDITKEEFEQIKTGQSITVRRGYYSNLYLGVEENERGLK